MEIILVFILGWVGGWIVNYLADVLPRLRSLSRPICIDCMSPLSWRNFLLLASCPHCQAKRRIRTWLAQFIMVISLMVFYFFPPVRLGFWLAALIFLYFMVVAVIDLEHKAILIPTTIFGFFLALFTGWNIHGLGVALLGGITGGAIMAGFYFFGIFFIRMMEKAKKQQIDETALGEGDVYLMVVLGLMMGWPEVIGGLILGILSAGLISGGLVLGSLLFKRYKALTAIPYAPFLLLGAFIMIFLARK